MVGRFFLSRVRAKEAALLGAEKNLMEVPSPMRDVSEATLPDITTCVVFDDRFPDKMLILLSEVISELGPSCFDLVWVVAWSSCLLGSLRGSMWVPLVSVGVIVFLQMIFYLFPKLIPNPSPSLPLSLPSDIELEIR
jgi:hypothetical protein